MADPWLAMYPEPSFAFAESGLAAFDYCPKCGDFTF
jgi:hypothetical protein